MGRFQEYLQRQRGPTARPADLLRVPDALRGEGPPRPGCIPGVGLIGAPMRTAEPETVQEGAGLRVATAAGAGLGLVLALFAWRAARRRGGRAAWWALTALFGLGAAGLAAAAVLMPVRTVEVLRPQVIDFPLVGYGGTLVVSTIPVRPSGAIETEPGGLPKVAAAPGGRARRAGR